jgi:hypothetical protein
MGRILSLLFFISLSTALFAADDIILAPGTRATIEADDQVSVLCQEPQLVHCQMKTIQGAGFDIVRVYQGDTIVFEANSSSSGTGAQEALNFLKTAKALGVCP